MTIRTARRNSKRVDFSYGTLLKIYIHKLNGLSDVYVNNICYKYHARVHVPATYAATAENNCYKATTYEIPGEL